MCTCFAPTDFGPGQPAGLRVQGAELLLLRAQYGAEDLRGLGVVHAEGHLEKHGQRVSATKRLAAVGSYIIKTPLI